jgi:hypothetical protein
MDAYFELFLLRHRDRAAFYRLFVMSLLQHFVMFYVMYLTTSFIHPFFGIILALYGEVLLSLYLTHKMYESWRRRTTEEW